MDNPHTGSTYTSSTVMGEFCINDVTCDVSSVCEPMVWLTMFLFLANFELNYMISTYTMDFSCRKLAQICQMLKEKKIQNTTFL
jgi:hypothetical protein